LGVPLFLERKRVHEKLGRFIVTGNFLKKLLLLLLLLLLFTAIEFSLGGSSP
jgi:hypothetical protein